MTRQKFGDVFSYYSYLSLFRSFVYQQSMISVFLVDYFQWKIHHCKNTIPILICKKCLRRKIMSRINNEWMNEWIEIFFFFFFLRLEIHELVRKFKLGSIHSWALKLLYVQLSLVVCYFTLHTYFQICT